MENSLSFPAKQTGNAQFSFIDASSFFVVEATGDSEVDLDPNVATEDLAVGGDDDAESSSCDVSDQSRVPEFNYSSFEKVEESNVNDVVVDDDEEEEEEEVEKDRRDVGSDGLQGIDKKSCVSLDSTNESMNEMEKSRLFWETCLAS